MALPKLNDAPKYEVTIPSMNKKTRFRPYLVGEEKVLLIAAESDDINQITRATLDLVQACIEDPIDVNKLSSFDAEYLFLKIRSKSVGETSDLFFLCEECEHETSVTLNLNDVTVEFPDDTSNIIEISPGISLEMKYLSYNDSLSQPEIAEAKDDISRLYAIIMNSIEAVLTQDERLQVNEEPKEELEAFVNSMTSRQFEKLREFVLNTPSMKLGVEFECEGCKHKNQTTLRGLSDFFE